ncbi:MULTISPECIES: aminotransferase class V-fold PLP-dependent enzyme [Clostridia]|uniref:aminotransferase class V-fold PLP-dependent enzyme n=1 Tax=Clostridia TaxID=186801 RepID=UPI0012B3AAAB|nr:aminotransferase class V-fold PLP-dependent enzyme [Clostridium sp. WB02_MRS01]MBW4847152.1 aminotransferase class V-fold PLP-dependent enzyme [Lachnospiraceae bacterium]MSS08639.1 aminotransferase class V-fold PLP-dependent enzyme [Clostridium sp. WB02_MRS01]
MIYLDNAATSCRKPEEVIQAVTDAMRSFGNSGRGAHGASLDASRLIFDTRRLIAELFHAGDPSRVAFTANSTASLNMAIQGLFKPGDHVITTMMEHNSVLRPLYRMEEQGAELTILPADQKGRIRYEDIEKAVKQNTKAVVCTHASNLTGNINDLELIGNICKRNGLLLVVDASQTAGVFDIDMEKTGIHVLCFTGHKGLLGPQGTGGICVREGVSIRPYMVGGSGVKSYLKTQPEEMPEVLEAGTLNGHGIAGLHAALLYLKETGIETIRERELLLMRRFYEGVTDIPGVKVYGDFSEKALLFRAPVVALNIGDYDSGEVADELACSYGIYTRAGAHCAPLMHQALGTVEQGAVRFSMSHYNKEEEIDEAIRAVRELSL